MVNIPLNKTQMRYLIWKYWVLKIFPSGGQCCVENHSNHNCVIARYFPFHRSHATTFQCKCSFIKSMISALPDRSCVCVLLCPCDTSGSSCLTWLYLSLVCVSVEIEKDSSYIYQRLLTGLTTPQRPLTTQSLMWVFSLLIIYSDNEHRSQS